jgi:periplasmic protein TonB
MSFQSLTRSGLGRALALSLMVHILLLWPSSPGQQANSPANLLTATLRRTLSPMTGEHVPEKARNPAADDSEPKVNTSDADPSTVVDRSTVPNGARSNDQASSAKPADDVVNAEGLRGYRLALAREASRHKSYPQQAIDAGWQGTVELRVTIPADGRPQQALVASSGFALLDSAAAEMLRLALATTQIPESIRGRSFSVNLPIVFELPE